MTPQSPHPRASEPAPSPILRGRNGRGDQRCISENSSISTAARSLHRTPRLAVCRPRRAKCYFALLRQHGRLQARCSPHFHPAWCPLADMAPIPTITNCTIRRSRRLARSSCPVFVLRGGRQTIGSTPKITTTAKIATCRIVPAHFAGSHPPHRAHAGGHSGVLCATVSSCVVGSRLWDLLRRQPTIRRVPSSSAWRSTQRLSQASTPSRMIPPEPI